MPPWSSRLLPGGLRWYALNTRLLKTHGEFGGVRKTRLAFFSSSITQLFLPMCTSSKNYMVNALKVRRNQPEASNFAFKVRSIQKPHGWSRFWSRGFGVRDEHLCHLFSPEKCPVVVKRSRTLEMVSNLHLQKIALKVRRDGPQPRILGRTFSLFTTPPLRH